MRDKNKNKGSRQDGAPGDHGSFQSGAGAGAPRLHGGDRCGAKEIQVQSRLRVPEEIRREPALEHRPDRRAAYPGWERVDFDPRSFGCPCRKCKRGVPAHLLEPIIALAIELQKVQRVLARSLRIDHAYLCVEENERRRGLGGSFHLVGTAANVYVSTWPAHQLLGFFEALIRLRLIRNGGLFVEDDNLIHYDMGPGPPRR